MSPPDGMRGTRRLILHNNNQDPSQIQQGLAKIRTHIRTFRQRAETELAAPPAPWNFPLRQYPATESRGKVSARFLVTWDPVAPANPFTNGTGEVSMTFDGKTLAYRELGVMAGPNNSNRLVGYPVVRMYGLLQGQPVPQAISVIVTPELFRPGSMVEINPYDAIGIYLDEFRSPLDYRVAALIHGTINLEKASTEPGATISGKFEGKLQGWKWSRPD